MATMLLIIPERLRLCTMLGDLFVFSSCSFFVVVGVFITDVLSTTANGVLRSHGPVDNRCQGSG